MLSHIALLGCLATAYCWRPWYYYAPPDTTCVHTTSSARPSTSISFPNITSTTIPLPPDLPTITPSGALANLTIPTPPDLPTITPSGALANSAAGRFAPPRSPPPRPTGSTTGVCPPFIPSPATTTIVDTIVTGANLTDTHYEATSTITVAGNISYTYKILTTSGADDVDTITVTSISVLGQTATVTIPTPSGFIPVSCQPEFWRSTVTKTSQRTRTTALTTVTAGYVERVYNYSTVSTITVTAAPINLPVYTTVTSIRSDPTSTFYQACATNNVVAQRPNGYIGAVLEAYTTSSLASFKLVTALDQVDCCAQCQAAQCVGSVYQPPSTTFNSAGLCYLGFSTNNGTCDATYPGLIVLQDEGSLRNYISNGPCGEFAWADYGSVRIDT